MADEKPWVDSTEAEDAAKEAQGAREAAAKTTGRGAKNERVMNKTLEKAEPSKKTRRAILYGKDDDI